MLNVGFTPKITNYFHDRPFSLDICPLFLAYYPFSLA